MKSTSSERCLHIILSGQVIGNEKKGIKNVEMYSSNHNRDLGTHVLNCPCPGGYTPMDGMLSFDPRTNLNHSIQDSRVDSRL